MARRITVQIVGDSAQLERSFKRAGDASETFGKRMGVSMKSFAKAGAVGAAAGGLALVTKQLFSSVKAAKEAELAETRLAGAFDQARVKAEDRVKAQEAIGRVSRKAALDDEALSDVLAKLTRTTGSVQKGMKGMALAANIARARNISLEAAAKIVEKAHVGQLRGLKGLGVEIGKGTTSTEALERAQRKFAGSAERYGKTAAGAQDRLSVAFENLQEKVGQKLLPVLQRLALRLIDLIDWTEKNWPRISRSLKPAVAVVQAAFENVAKVVKSFASAFEGVVKIFDGIRSGKWSQVWAGIKQVVVDGALGMVKAVTELPRKILAALGSAAWNKLQAIGAAIKNAALDGLRGMGDAIAEALRGVVNRLIRLVNAAVDKFNAVLGKVGVKIPKIPEIESDAKRRARADTAGAARTTRPSGPRDRGEPARTLPTGPRDRMDPSRVPASAGRPAAPSFSLVVDGRELGRVVVGRAQRASRETAASRRGPFASQRLALG